MNIIETTCVYTKQNLLELQKVLHRRTAKICMWLMLAGAAILTAGIFLMHTLQSGIMIYFGAFWTVFFLIRRNHAARKSARSTVKGNRKAYGCDVTTHQKFYATMVTAENEQSGKTLRQKYDEVTRVVVTRHIVALISADGVALLSDRRSVDEATDAELLERLRTGCTGAFWDED